MRSRVPSLATLFLSQSWEKGVCILNVTVMKAGDASRVRFRTSQAPSTDASCTSGRKRKIQGRISRFPHGRPTLTPVSKLLWWYAARKILWCGSQRFLTVGREIPPKDSVAPSVLKRWSLHKLSVVRCIRTKALMCNRGTAAKNTGRHQPHFQRAKLRCFHQKTPNKQANKQTTR